MPASNAMESDVKDAIARDPRIHDPSAIAVTVEDGVATLRGTVGSLRQRMAAGNDAAAVDGVHDVSNALKVSILDGGRREDADIRGVALQKLMWDTEVPPNVDVEVSDGWVTLKGEANNQYQSDAAFNDVIPLRGVTGVTNKIRVVTYQRLHGTRFAAG